MRASVLSAGPLAGRGLAISPGVELGPYPERSPQRRDALEAAARRLGGLLWPHARVRGSRQARFVARVQTLAQALDGLPQSGLYGVTRDLRATLARRDLNQELLAKAFAVAREMSGRVLGMRHHPCQLAGGWIIANGMLAEMHTGEGKTLTATLPACAAALAGVPVHVVTTNDYLARRDAESMAPLYEAMGLSVGVAGEGDDPQARRRAHACSVTYCTAKQLAFDYLHDKVLRGASGHRWQLQLDRLHGGAARVEGLLLRGLCFAIVDEADSIFIDEARTPLILSRSNSSEFEQEVYRRGHALAAGLRQGSDFRLSERESQVELTDAGRARLAEEAAALGGVFRGARRRESLVLQALTARWLFHRDRDYIVSDGKVVIVDHNTGRPMPDRSWEQGLHQMVELEEGCAITGARETLASTTFQRFFRRYLHLGGMTGTAREVATELRAVYGLPVVTVAPHRPPRRTALPPMVYASREAKWRGIAARIRARVAKGQPVLVGTRSVEESEGLSAHLAASGIAHQVLNARQDRHEAEVVARAGEPGRVTVATNMAGRGTDIALAPGVAERGGLHVIVAECNDAARIDRQLVGRTARKGQPGSHEVVLSLDDLLVERFVPRVARLAAAALRRADGRVPRLLGMRIAGRAQRAVERRHAAARRAVLRLDEHLADALAFAGRPE